MKSTHFWRHILENRGVNHVDFTKSFFMNQAPAESGVSKVFIRIDHASGAGGGPAKKFKRIYPQGTGF